MPSANSKIRVTLMQATCMLTLTVTFYSCRRNCHCKHRPKMLQMVPEVAVHMANRFLTDDEAQNWARCSHHMVRTLRRYCIKGDVALQWVFATNSRVSESVTATTSSISANTYTTSPRKLIEYEEEEQEVTHKFRFGIPVHVVLQVNASGDAWIKTLINLPTSVRHIKIRGRPNGPRAPELASIGTLISLELFHCINDAGLRELADAIKVSTSMTSINLSHNSIGDEGVLALADATKVSPSMTHINLSHNSIGDEGALALADAIKVSTSMTHIDLSHNSIGVKGALAVWSAIEFQIKARGCDMAWNLSRNLAGVSHAMAAAMAPFRAPFTHLPIHHSHM